MAASRKQSGASQAPKIASASQEHCFSCFDALIARLKDSDALELTTPPSYSNADSRNITACVAWSNATHILGMCMSFHADETLAFQLDDLAKKSGRSIYKATDVQNLKCTVYFVDRETIVQTKSTEDWDVGKHGIYVQFADPRTGKQFTKAYLPEAIVKRGWSKKEAVEHIIRRSGYDGPITKELLASVTLSRFPVHSSATATFNDYRANFAASVRAERAAHAAANGSQDAKARLEVRAKLFDYLDQEKARKVKLEGKREGSRKFSYIAGGLFAALLVALVVLLRYQQSYSVFYEEFLENYDVLGVAREAPMADVKKAHREMSLKWHPDKNPGCADCGAKYARIAEAYRQITDREKGTLKFKDQPQRPGSGTFRND